LSRKNYESLPKVLIYQTVRACSFKIRGLDKRPLILEIKRGIFWGISLRKNFFFNKGEGRGCHTHTDVFGVGEEGKNEVGVELGEVEG
jgi:hypothetical protein